MNNTFCIIDRNGKYCYYVGDGLHTVCCIVPGTHDIAVLCGPDLTHEQAVEWASEQVRIGNLHTLKWYKDHSFAPEVQPGSVEGEKT